MSDNYLTEADFVYQSNNSLLKQKSEDITNHTGLVLLDLSDEDIELIEEKEIEFQTVKNDLFSNSDKLLNGDKLGLTKDELTKLYEVQANLLALWKEFGLTDGFFHRYYQTFINSQNNQLDDSQKEQLDLLLHIMNEQITLVIAFSVMNDKSVILDVADFM
jgi:hypothetical protein